MKKTRKILSFILTFSMLFVTIPQSVAVWAASDEAEYAVSLASSAESVEEGETFTVTVSISSSDSEASAAALHGKITYDTSGTEYVSAAAPTDSGLNVDASADGGTVTLSVYGESQRVSGDGAVMAELTFRALTPGSASFSVSDGAVVGKSGASADIPAKSGDSISVTVSAAAQTPGDYDLTLGMEDDGLTWTILTVNGETVNREVAGGTTVSNISDVGDIITFCVTAPDNVQYLNVYPHPYGSDATQKTVEFNESGGIYTLVMPGSDDGNGQKHYCVDATTLKLPDSEDYSVTANLTEYRIESSTYVWIWSQISDIVVTSADGRRLTRLFISTDGGDSWSVKYPSAQDGNTYTFDDTLFSMIYTYYESLNYYGIDNMSLTLKAEFASETITSISTEEELLRFAQAVNAGDTYSGVTVTLQNDIALTQPWTESIGNDEDHPFNGTFDGGGHTVSGLVIDYTYDVDSTLPRNARYFGLFGVLVSAEIRNLNVEGTIDVDDPVTDWDYATSGSQYSYIGGIAAHSSKTNFISCTSDVDITASSGAVAGISGSGSSQYFTDCFNYGDLKITGRNYEVSGISEVGSMLRCGNYGNITVDCGPVYTMVSPPASSGSTNVTIKKYDTATGYAGGTLSL